MLSEAESFIALDEIRRAENKIKDVKVILESTAEQLEKGDGSS